MRTAGCSSFLVAILAAACAAPDEPRTSLPNGGGKDDSVAMRITLSAASPSVELAVGCDQPHGCEGSIDVTVQAPEVCALFPLESRCGQPGSGPLSRDVADVQIVSSTEGPRLLPLTIWTEDGVTFTSSIAAAFTARTSEEVGVTITKRADAPDLSLRVAAQWIASPDPGASAQELVAYLQTVPGLTFYETGTSHGGYRAYVLHLDQPLDHANQGAGTFQQQMVLHHRTKDAPLVLYTSGYSLFSYDHLSELGTAMQANQISTEQRFFGSSFPADFTPASWQHVNVEQAAKDHHRIVEALRPYYAKPWLSTGHSKGGMTSIYHRRFFPDDVQATVAYVAPISYAHPDPRYIPFLDRIGDEACRTAIRGVQRSALERIGELVPYAASESAGLTFTRAGGHDSAFEKSILMLEWAYWQYQSADDCAPFLTPPTDTAGLYELVAGYVGAGIADEHLADSQAYYYQAATQLGRQDFATAHLAGLLRHEDKVFDWAPEGTTPVHDPSAMHDVQAWVTSSASQLLFVYGGADPWTGGAFDPGTRQEVVKLVVPRAPHTAQLDGLAAADLDLALRKIEDWTGTRPSVAGLSGGSNPALPLLP